MIDRHVRTGVFGGKANVITVERVSWSVSQRKSLSKLVIPSKNTRKFAPEYGIVAPSSPIDCKGDFMKLYHGCSAKDLRSIMTNGLCPRQDKQSNWEKNPSRPDMVYLTVAYAFYFALCHEGLAGVVEIETRGLDRKGFFPDEDFLTNAFAMHGGQELDAARKGDIRVMLHTYGDYWKESVRYQGNCCYQGTISPRFITRYCIFDPKARPVLAEEISGDPCINLGNYETKGKSYQQLVAWMFGDKKVLPMVAECKELIELFRGSPANAEYLEDARKGLALWKKESRDRTGIEVWDRGNDRRHLA